MTLYDPDPEPSVDATRGYKAAGTAYVQRCDVSGTLKMTDS